MSAKPEQFVVDGRGRKTGVILPIQRYRRLIEDLHDLAAVAERRDEEPIGTDEVRQRIQADGPLPADI